MILQKLIMEKETKSEFIDSKQVQLIEISFQKLQRSIWSNYRTNSQLRSAKQYTILKDLEKLNVHSLFLWFFPLAYCSNKVLELLSLFKTTLNWVCIIFKCTGLPFYKSWLGHVLRPKVRGLFKPIQHCRGLVMALPCYVSVIPFGTIVVVGTIVAEVTIVAISSVVVVPIAHSFQAAFPWLGKCCCNRIALILSSISF